MPVVIKQKIKLARPAGFEPATLGLEGRCSIQMSYGRVLETTLCQILQTKSDGVSKGERVFFPFSRCNQKHRP